MKCKWLLVFCGTERNGTEWNGTKFGATSGKLEEKKNYIYIFYYFLFILNL